MQDIQHFRRGEMLLSQGRPELAERELRLHLAGHPNDGTGHAFLALCLLQQDKNLEALSEAERAVGLEPGDPFPHYIRALVLHDLERYKDAEAAATEAVRLDPGSADNHYILGLTRLARDHFVSSLEAAETGLELDADHVGCNNLRAMALVKLGRKEEAGATIDATLRRDPNNSHSHANQGWTYLHRGEHRKALEHFRESLRIDPSNEWARQGLIESLKAEYLIYRWMLAYYLWASRLSGKAQWVFVIGLFIGQRVLRGLADSNPAIAPFIWPILWFYLVFWILTWISGPLFNLLLRLNKFGRHALSRGQTWAANLVGVLILSGIVMVGLGLVFGSIVVAFGGAGMWLLTLPVSATFAKRKPVSKWVLGSATAVLALLVLAFMVLGLSDQEDASVRVITIFGFLFFAFQWVAMAMK